MRNKQNNDISIRGARVNNLKNVDVDIPRNQLTVITGLSGSGKSSLAYDTLSSFSAACRNRSVTKSRVFPRR